VVNAHDSVRAKVQGIFLELAGGPSEALRAERVAKDVIARLKSVFAAEYSPEIASTLGMHLSDWNADAAFLVALHLFPARFTDEEIKAGVGMFLCHAPNHVRAACQITGQYVWEDFPESDPGMQEIAP
jgi:hypothetical protein